MFPNTVEYMFLWYDLRMLWISLVFVVVCPFPFLIVLYLMSLSSFISYSMGLSILFIFMNNLIFNYFICFYMIYLSTQLYYYRFYPLTGHVCFFGSISFICVQSPVCVFSLSYELSS